MAYNTRYQQKAYIIIMCIKININILCHFLCNDLTDNILLKMCSLLSKFINICQRLILVYTFTTMNAE